MTRTAIGVAVMLAIGMGVGCDRGDADQRSDSGTSAGHASNSGYVPPGSSANPTTGPSEADLRLTAANAVYDTAQRDKALAEVAAFAADHNQPDVVNKALEKITATADRDAAMSTSALTLARGGNTAAAIEIAGRITDAKLRDTTNAKIAKGETN